MLCNLAVLEALDLHVVATEDGRSNLPQLPQTEASAEGDEPIDYLVSAFAVRRASLRYEDRANAITTLAEAEAVAAAQERARRRTASPTPRTSSGGWRT